MKLVRHHALVAGAMIAALAASSVGCAESSPETVHELVALIKTNPGKYSFASGGTGTQPHLAGEQFRMSLGLDLVHVPHNGGGPALASAIAGHTPIIFSTLSPGGAFHKGGQVAC